VASMENIVHRLVAGADQAHTPRPFCDRVDIYVVAIPGKLQIYRLATDKPSGTSFPYGTPQ